MEEQRICAFIDVLGFSDVMLGDDEDRRRGLIDLLHRLAGRTEAYGPNVQNLGMGVAMAPSAEVSTFSDNVVISFPLTTMRLPARIGNESPELPLEAAAFMNHMLIQIVTAVWDGLKLGVLFRGGISRGRLFHDGRVVAGEALVRAARLEKATSLPRIEIDREVLEAVDERGRPIVEDHVRESCIAEEGDRFFVRTLDFHSGYWRDHNWHRQQAGQPAEDVAAALQLIRDRVAREGAEAIRQTADPKVREKWDWFRTEFEGALSTGLWAQVMTKQAQN